ncbi:MAG TPA: phosphate acyltransferase PlsX [Candidatus Anaerofilum excrementigallinarum]|nr:phosphate acyltransferase PlsX [Candidatus Anaerofilum excrementigallinarum]
MKIIIDAMGGDNAPAEILRGAADAVAELGVEILAVGDQKVILACAAEHNIPLQGIQILQASQAIEMCEEPAKAVRTKKDSSLVVGLKALAEGQGDAFVSAGSTGALHVGTSLIVRTIKGVKRPALGTIIPGGEKPYLLLDCGANVECRAPMLNTFGVMGSVYMNKVMGVESPAVALVNNGAEETKGTPLYKEAHQLLKANPAIRFVGNIEPRDVPSGQADVVVCDGFTGNVILKLTEGLAKTLMGQLKPIFTKNLATKLAFLTVKDGMKAFKKKMDADEYGGAPLLGASRPVIKAHGSSNAKAFKNAIRQAMRCAEMDLSGTMERSLAALAAQSEE